MRKKNTRTKSIIGNNIIPNPTTKEDSKGKFDAKGAYSTNFIARILITSPVNIEPESPKNILAGSKLKNKNDKRDDEKVKARIP